MGDFAGSQSPVSTATLSTQPNEAAVAINLATLPPVFVLPTHLTQSELHRVEDQLANANAPLTYDIEEAKLVLGNVGTKRRAEFELRCRKLWTQEVATTKRSLATADEKHTEPEPAQKRKRIQEPAEKEDLPSDPSVSENASSIIPDQNAGPGTRIHEAEEREAPLFKNQDSIKVIKLDWFTNSVDLGILLDPEPYKVYEGIKVERPESLLTSKTLPTAHVASTAAQSIRSLAERKELSKGILERAKVDLDDTPSKLGGLSQYATAGSDPRPYNHHARQSGDHGFTRPTHLLRQTTSEHDDGSSNELPEMPAWVKQGQIYACQRSTPPNPPNKAFIDQLEKIKLARILINDEIGVRAYSTSIASLCAYPFSLTTTREILALPGCDVKIAHLFHEWKSNGGHIRTVEEIDKDETLKVLKLFYDIWGVGATTAKEFYYDRGWRDLDDIVEYGWHDLSRVQQIGVKYYDEFLKKIPRPEVELIADKVMEHARRVRDNDMVCCIVGGYRRGKQECGDVDMIVSHPDEEKTLGVVTDIVASLEAEGWITHTLTLNLTTSNRGQQTLPYRSNKSGVGFDSLDKALVVWQDINWSTKESDLAVNPKAKNPNIHRRLDIIIAPWHAVGCGIVGWSGGTTFQRDLRRYARKVKGWKFDSSGIRDRVTGAIVDVEAVGGRSKTWEEAERKVFAGLGLEYREPWERCTG
ncbi:terminal deoxynucleotidyl transferas-like protein [Xylona heveae TC161]|uniref:DNA polymerase n=1 Tax=Xylona heveae (strain CBS 132557 / TC161) TaxID=1328760 RepID=A0A165FWW0_XYLHT|nr:terminal deoxynucleotidyl transferas-like protein [Xylona heveae TC161]KZF21481.1 terminal deoxynucleotidyl transferas-like protein [Xylona heveae TC161]